MPTNVAIGDRIHSWKEIAAYLERDVSTVIRWEKERGLPVHRIPGGQRQAVYAWRHEIDQWLQHGHREPDDPKEVPEEMAKFQAPALQVSNGRVGALSQDHLSPGSPKQSFPNSSRSRALTLATVAAIVVIAAIGAYALRAFVFSHSIRFTGVVQLTDDGAMKFGLVTDGRNIYFGEDLNGRIVLSSIPVEGGAIREIPTPFVKALPADISRDGKDLLVLVREGHEDEKQLWVVPVAGEQPHRVGSIRCHTAAWSPDGRNIVFAAQNEVFETSDLGKSVRQLQAFDGVPKYLRWSWDGKRIRVDVVDLKSGSHSLSDIVLSNEEQASVDSVIPLHVTFSNGNESTFTLDEEGRSFVSGGSLAKTQLYLLSRHREIWENSGITLDAIKSAIGESGALALDSGSKRLFTIADSAVPQNGEEHYRGELVRLDAVSRKFTPYLPGKTFSHVDFSRNGSWITYVQMQDHTLWISRPDGSAAQKIAVPSGDIQLPRWSPDGKWIAFMAKFSGRPWRIFVYSVATGKFREASTGTDSQGAPTWSPDGKWLAYGNVDCQEIGNCAIRKIELSSGREVVLPGSEGLGTARWSPDGRFIAALSNEHYQVLMFDIASQRWRKLAEGVNGNDLSWSADSHFVFASKPSGDRPEILRISVKDKRGDDEIDLSSFTKWTGHIDTWFTLAPDGSIIFQRGFSGNEIYAMSYQEQ